jgi:hypothetical protein
MTDRRRFLQSAAALSATPFAARAAFAAAGPSRYDAFVYDTRHAAAVELAARTGHAGLPARAIDGDITALWQRELAHRWLDQPRAIAGLTERPALYLLEQLGWEHGLRVVFQAEHEPGAAGQARHRLIRGGAPGLGADLAAAGRHWPQVVADALLRDRYSWAREFGPADVAMASHYAEGLRLYSWVIAPRTAV